MVHSPELVSLLDPDRDYGDKTFEEVKEGIARGLIVIEPGHSLPVLRDPTTNRAIKGTGRPPGSAAQEWSRTFVREFVAGDDSGTHEPRIAVLMQSAFDAVVTRGDMKALELLLKYGIGDHREMGSDAGSRAVDALMQLAQNARTERVIQVDG